MFCGKYLADVNGREIRLRHGFGGNKVSVLCLKSNEECLFVAVCADETEIKEYSDVYAVVDCRQEEINDVVELPEIFLKHLDGEKILTVVGVGKGVEILKNNSLDHLFL